MDINRKSLWGNGKEPHIEMKIGVLINKKYKHMSNSVGDSLHKFLQQSHVYFPGTTYLEQIAELRLLKFLKDWMHYMYSSHYPLQ